MFHLTKELISLTWDLFYPARPEQVLNGTKMFRPFLNYQESWLNFTHPGETLDPKINTWQYLQKWMMPLIQQNASQYHLEGVKKLQLDLAYPPDFKQFQNDFFSISNGFKIEAVKNEIKPAEYFEMIRSKNFPCVEKIRGHEELFCGNEPDFWHESIGHIAPLYHPTVQDIYIEIANILLSSPNKKEFQKRLAVAWTLLEYGFIEEDGGPKMFGAAIVGSHLANIRYLHHLISIEPALRKNILAAKFFDENVPVARTIDGNLRFFTFDIHRRKISDFFEEI